MLVSSAMLFGMIEYQFDFRSTQTNDYDGISTTYYDYIWDEIYYGTNYWEIASYFFEWPQLSIWALAFTTQLLSLFGVGNYVNVWVWTNIVGRSRFWFNQIYYAIALFSAIELYSQTTGVEELADVNALRESNFEVIWMEIYTNFAVQTLVNLIIYYFGKSWVIKQASKMNDE